jgi:predicted Zn-dependent protease
MKRLRWWLANARRRPGLAVMAVALAAAAAYGAREGVAFGAAAYHGRAAARDLDRRDFAAARAHLDAALSWRPKSSELLLLAARAARRDGDLVTAGRLLDACGKQPPAPAGLGVERALLCVQGGDLRAGEGGLLARLHADPPDAPVILEVLVPAYLREFELVSAYRWLEYWLRRDPGNAQAQLWMSDVAERLGVPQQALDSARAAAAAEPGSAAAHLRCGRLLLRARQPQEALGHYEWLQTHHPEDKEARLGLARCRRETGEERESARLLDDLLRDDPGNAAALAERGYVDLGAGRPEEALPRLREAARRLPSDPDLLYNYALCLEQCGRPDEARPTRQRLERCHADLDRLKELRAAISRDPHNPALRCEAGEILLRNDQAREAIRWFESALREDPAYGPAKQALTDYRDRAGRAKESGGGRS